MIADLHFEYIYPKLFEFNADQFNPKLNPKPEIKILVAEDDKINQIVLIKMLEKLGYQADLVANGFEVLKALNHTRYDLIFMDIQMPEMDGLKATFKIRESSQYQKQPIIIAVTAHLKEKVHYLSAGMDDYLSKPYHKEQIHSLLMKHIEQ